MERRRRIVVCTVVGFLGLLSAILGFAAEAKRIKGSEIKFSSPNECVYPRSPALALGLSAAVSLLIAQIIINVATGCICCCRHRRQSTSSSKYWTLSLPCFVVSWFTFILAFLLLLSGAALNDEHGEENIYFGSYYCYIVKAGVFAGAASLSLASVILGIIYYLSFRSEEEEKETETATAGSIVMGQPHPNQDPVFVHHDTYARRQLS